MMASQLLLATGWLCLASSTSVVRAQEVAPATAPALVLVPRHGVEEGRYDTTRPLVLTVEIAHPALFAAAQSADFVLDAEGGLGGALSLVVTSASGAAAEWTFAPLSASDGAPLRISPLGRADFTFELPPAATPIEPGRYEVRARLHAASGAWQGTAWSRPMPLEVRAARAAELTLLGLDEGELQQGWPVNVAVVLRAPIAGPGVAVPTDPGAAVAALRVTLRDEGGAVVPIGARITAAPAPRSGVLAPGEQHVFLCRVPAEASAALAPGAYRWSFVYHAPPNAHARGAWSGATRTIEQQVKIVLPVEPLTAELAARRSAVFLADHLAEASHLRAEALRRELALELRQDAVRGMASSLVRAEALALAAHRARPDDPEAALDLARVCAAAGDEARAEEHAARALALGERSFEALLRARAAQRVVPLQPAALAETLQVALAAARRGDDPTAAAPVAAAPTPTPAAPNPATPTPSTTDAAEAPLDAPTPAIAGVVSSGDARELDTRFAADPLGQWAATATASTQYSSPTYSAERATGPPDVAAYGDNGNAWTPSAADRSEEWLVCTFAAPVHATEVRVRQTLHPGAITRVTLSGVDGGALVVFTGVDPTSYPPSTVGWFVVTFPATERAVSTVTLTLDTARVPNWNEIDAVQLVGSPTR